MKESQIEEIYEETLMVWEKLDSKTKKEMIEQSRIQSFSKDEILHAGREDCSGLFLLHSGRIRAYIVTEEGKEITLFRLVEGEVCVFSASCMLKNISFDVWISAETEVVTAILPSLLYDKINSENPLIANFTNEIVNSRMSDVMWILEKVLFMRFDKRLAEFLYEQAALEGSDVLHITHEQIARHLGSAREVVSRMLKYLAQEGLIHVTRGSIQLLNRKKLYEYGTEK
ncbi:MAG: Crp/Fnr family transcriptional regulator [Lachnospiraceae bacterium]